MSHSLKFWSLLACTAALITALLLGFSGTLDKVWQLVKPELNQENYHLAVENEQLKHQIESLENQNMRLRKFLDEFEKNFSDLKAVAVNCMQIESMLPADLPAGLTKERFEIRQLYRDLVGEKKRWDQYQQDKYAGVLETTIEPRVIESQNLHLDNKDNQEYFVELESGLALHRRLIRDVRLFHDEIQFQKKQRYARQEYELYDLKFQLGPFARESALTDALQQAMSALSAGIYQQEAVEVLDRIGAEFTRPIQHLNEQLYETTETSDSLPYNYDLYTVYGKKLMDYSESLARQSAVTLAPSAFGELDFFNRRMDDSLYDLYEVGQEATIDPTRLDLDELERVIDSGS